MIIHVEINESMRHTNVSMLKAKLEHNFMITDWINISGSRAVVDGLKQANAADDKMIGLQSSLGFLLL